jgi:hypothetical protein
LEVFLKKLKKIANCVGLIFSFWRNARHSPKFAIFRRFALFRYNFFTALIFKIAYTAVF